MTSKKLTGKQEAFAVEYVRNGGEASAAYRTAYNTAGMKQETVHGTANKLTKHPQVAARIAELEAERERIAREKFEIDVERVLGMFVSAATYDPASFNNADGHSKPLSELTREQRLLLEPKVLRDGSVVYVPPSREAARNELGKIFQLSNKINLNVTDNSTAGEIADISDPVEALKAFQAARGQLH